MSKSRNFWGYGESAEGSASVLGSTGRIGMRVQVRFAVLALLVGALVAVSASAAQAAVEIEKFVGINCAEGFEHCGEKSTGKTDAFGSPLDETAKSNLAESE